MKALVCKYLKEEVYSNIVKECRIIDNEVYSEEFKGSEEKSVQRYNKCKDDLIVVLDGEIVIGYLVAFPISKGLRHRMIKSKVIIDDEIDIADMISYSRKNIIYLMSVVVVEEYRDGQAIALLVNAFKRNLDWHVTNGENIKEIIAEAVSEDGDELLSKMGFKKRKDLDDGNKLYIKKM